MRRTLSLALISAAALAAFAAPAHASTTPPDSTTPAETAAPADTAATAELEPAGSPTVVVVDETGSELAALTASAVEPAWVGFGEGDEPESGHEYLRVTVVVESRSPRGLFGVNADDFILQDADGFVTSADIVPTAEQSAIDEEPITEAELANAETVDLALTFEMVSGVAPLAVYYAPSSERLVTVLELS